MRMSLSWTGEPRMICVDWASALHREPCPRDDGLQGHGALAHGERREGNDGIETQRHIHWDTSGAAKQCAGK